MDKFEILKSNTIQFSIELNKKKLSDFLIADIIKLNHSFENSNIFSKVVENKEDLKTLKLFVNENKKNLKNGLYEYCLEEIREINDDLKFRNSKDGKVILELEDWVLKTRKHITSELENIKIFIGRSLYEPKELIIGGIVKEQNEIERLITFFENQNPPVKPNYKLEIE